MKILERTFISLGFIGFCALAASGQRPELVVQTGHSSSIRCIAFSPDGLTLASGSEDKTIRLWDVVSGRELRTLAGHRDLVLSVAFSPDGRTLATGSTDKTVRLWDVRTGRELRTVAGYAEAIVSVTFSPDGRTLATGGNSGTIRLGDVATGRIMRTLAPPNRKEDDVHSVAFSPDGKTLASGSKRIRLWDVVSGRELRTSAEDRDVLSVAFSRDGHMLANGTITRITIWQVRSWRKLRTLAGEWVDSVALSPDGNTLAASGRNDKTIKLWDLSTGRTQRKLAGHDEGPAADADRQQNDTIQGSAPYHSVNCMAFSPDGHTLASGSDDTTIKLWDAGSGHELRTLAGHAGGVTSLGFSRDGRTLASGSEDKTVKLWDVGNGRQLRTLEGHTDWVTSLALSPDGRTLATGSKDESIKVWDVASERELRTIEEAGSVAIWSLAFSPDGRTLASASGDAAIELWDPGNGHEVRTLAGHPGGVWNLAFSPDGLTLASGGGGGGGQDPTIRLWDVVSGGELRTLAAAGSSWTVNVAFSPDGRMLASGSNEPEIKLWDLDVGQEPRTLARQTGGVNSLAFSPDGHTLASAGLNDTILLSDVPTTGTKQPTVRSLAGHTDSVWSLAFRPNGATLASGSRNGTIKLWDVDQGRELASLFSLEQGDWIISDPEGRFDAYNLDEIKGLGWVFADEPFHALAPETFMRDYYEPRLLSRLLSGEQLPRVRPLQDLNRVQPAVKILLIRQGTNADLAEVTVEVSRAERQLQGDDKRVPMKTDVYDLRLFRAGQLVGQDPEPKAEVEESLKNGVELTPEQLQAWRDARRVKLDVTTGKAVRTFAVRLPHVLSGKEIEFSAYAFNEDRVKSETSRVSYTVPTSVGPIQRRAYLIAMGVNAYETQGWDLHFAASDARRIQGALAQRLAGYEVVPVTLTSDCRTEGCPEGGDLRVGVNHAQKAMFHGVLEKLAGQELSEELKKNLPPGAEKVQKANPDDLVVISVSSHGYTSKEGTFYMIPSDSGQTEGHGLTAELREKWISSDELSAWLRKVDAGDLVMIVDTCHSAATVEEPGFKPGPMGSRGLGQLAYDKGMRILAASQADDVALESEKLKQGVLTYALVHDGLEAKQAAKPGNSEITLDGWMEYGLERVPTLYQEVVQGKVQTFDNGSKDVVIEEKPSNGASSLGNPNAFQQPSLFNFQRHQSQILFQAGVGKNEATRTSQQNVQSPRAVFTVPEIAKLYNFPTELTGRGQTIGLIELGGGYTDSDVKTYFSQLNLPVPKIVEVSVDKGENQPGGMSDSQVTGDIEIAGAVAPAAQIVIYFAPNTDQGFLDAISTAIHDTRHRPSIISIGWGAPEQSWTGQAIRALDAVLEDAAAYGTTVVADTRDRRQRSRRPRLTDLDAAAPGITVVADTRHKGLTDGLQGLRAVNFTASSPWVLACGGTQVVASGGHIVSETAWDDGTIGGSTGGGVSTIFAVPDWQASIKIPAAANGHAGRAIPDVAANASPNSGYRVYLRGKQTVTRGTSEVAPLWAGLIALINQGLGRNVGYLNPILYKTLGPGGAFRLITKCDNSYGDVNGDSVGPGWNLCTGWGSPDGRKLLNALKAYSESSHFSIKGHAKLQDCWLDGPQCAQCGFQFTTGCVVPRYLISPDVPVSDVVVKQALSRRP